MIRKRKIAIVVAGAFLLVGVAFGVSANNRDGLKSSIFESRRGGFVCTPQAVTPDSRETKQYNANHVEFLRLQERRDTLRSDINVFENTCKNLKGKAKTQCQKNVSELRTVEKRFNNLGTKMDAYQNCKIEQYPRPTVVVDDQVANVTNNGDVATLGSFIVSYIVDKGYDVAVSVVPFHILDSNARGKFSDIQITDGIKTYPCHYFDTAQSMIECDMLDFDPIKPQGSKTFSLKARLGPNSAIGDKYQISLNGLGFNKGSIPNNPLIDPVKYIMNMEVRANNPTQEVFVELGEGENAYVSSYGDMLTHVQYFTLKSPQSDVVVKEVKIRIEGEKTVKSISIGTPLGMVSHNVENNYVIFKDLNLFIPKGQQGISLLLYPMYSEISSSTIPSGTRSTIVLDSLTYQSKTTNQNSNIKTNTYGRTMIVVGSVPQILFHANSSLEKIVGDTARIFEFSLGAYSGDIVFYEIPFYIENVGTDDSKANSIIVKDNFSGEIIPTENEAYGFGKSTILKFTNGYKISASSVHTFSVYIPVSGATQGPITTKLINENYANLIWSDWSFDITSKRGWGEGIYISNYDNDFISIASR